MLHDSFIAITLACIFLLSFLQTQRCHCFCTALCFSLQTTQVVPAITDRKPHAICCCDYTLLRAMKSKTFQEVFNSSFLERKQHFKGVFGKKPFLFKGFTTKKKPLQLQLIAFKNKMNPLSSIRH